MAGTISMSGLGSGMDIDGIVTALVNAASIPETAMQNRLIQTNSASTSISDISSLLSKLKTTVDDLSTPEKAQSYSVSSSDSAINASISTTSSAARYSVDVKALAQEYRAYTGTFSSLTTAVAPSTGQMSIKVGTNDAVKVDISSTDSLNTLVDKINSAGMGVTASTLFDGTNYRMQLRGVDSGANKTVLVTGTDLGLGANTKQQAADAHLVVDGFDVYSHSNVVSGAIPGVTLTVSDTTDSAANVEIKSDASSVKTKVQSFIDAYNAVVKKVHTTSGYGSTAASETLLAGNSTLRSLTTTMSNTIRTPVNSGNSAYSTLYSLGIGTASDGTLTLDGTKFNKAVTASPEAVTKIFAGSTSSSNGVMDLMSSMVKSFTDSSKGILTNQLTNLKSGATRISSQISSFETRMTQYEARLRTQFANMDSLVSAANNTMTYLSKLG